MKSQSITFFDADFPIGEQLPREFDVSFREVVSDSEAKVEIYVDNQQIGEGITDNAYENDYYRFHDIFHFSYVAILGWSPCVRNMLRRKRKSVSKIDEVEDGARAIITEEAISLLVFSYARQNKLYSESNEVDPILLQTIEKLVSDFEVSRRSITEWEKAILKGYAIFRRLKEHKRGVVHVDMINRDIVLTDH